MSGSCEATARQGKPGRKGKSKDLTPGSAICAIAMATENALTQSNSMALMGDVAKSENRHMALGAIFLWRDLGIVIPLFVAGALNGLLPNPADTEAASRAFHASLFGFAGLFFLCAFLTDALRRAVRRLQAT